MTESVEASAPGRQMPLELRRSSLSRRRRITDLVAVVAIFLCVAVAAVPVALVVAYLVRQGAGVMSWEFLTADMPRQAQTLGGGIGPAVVGTIVTVGFASLLAVPLGILGAIYLVEYGKQRPVARTIRAMADIMTGVPSIMMGLFIYVSFVLVTQNLNALSASLALACLMLPLIIRTTEEMLNLVPDDLRHAGLALGARKWRTIISVVLPAAIPGITSGVLLAVARAAGETAPIYLVIGLTYRANWSLFGPNTSLPAQIFKNAQEPFPAANERAWGAALTLVAIVFIFTVVGRFLANRFSSRER